VERGWRSPNSDEGTCTVGLCIYKYFVVLVIFGSQRNIFVPAIPAGPVNGTRSLTVVAVKVNLASLLHQVSTVNKSSVSRDE
jgi:hypothetical protein